MSAVKADGWIDYVCVNCGRKLLEASAPLNAQVTLPCKRCSQVVAVRPREWQETYRCTRCNRHMHVERPRRDRDNYCPICGTQSMLPVTPVEAPAQEARSGR